jgi:tol-pal system protein YbgF
MNRHRLRAHLACTLPAAALAAALICAPGAGLAQERSGGFLDNLFSRGQPQQQEQAPPAQAAPGPAQPGPADNSESARIDRIENALRQLTGTIEQLQHQNQMLQMQLKRMQDDTEYRFQQMGVKGGAAPMAPAGAAPMGSPGAAPPVNSGRRSDVFDPSQHPNAPGAPRTLGNPAAIAAPEPSTTAANAPPVGAPGGRDVGAPLDLSTMAGNPPPVQPPVQAAGSAPVAAPQSAPAPMPAPEGGQLPPPQPRNTSASGVRLATLPPSASPKDEYDMAYGYVLHKDYPLAEQAFRDFIRKYPSEHLLPDAQYWLGESQFQQQRYRDAAETFLAVSTKYEHSGKAPDALLRLGQSLAALHQKEAACATLAEVARKFPRASAGVKRGVAREQKRVHC